MFAKKINNPSNDAPILLSIVIILFISSFFMPFFFVSMIQDLIYHSKTHWFYNTPTASYLIFLCGTLWIPIVLSIFLFFRSKVENKIKLWIMTGLGLCLSIPFFVLGVDHYYFFDDKGLHYNHLISVNQLDYRWDEIESVEEVLKNENGTTFLEKLIFTTNDGKVFHIPNNTDYSDNRYKMKETYEKYNIKVIKKDPY